VRYKGMKTAFSCWKGRIAPVFDVAPEICLVETGVGGALVRATENVPDGPPIAKALRLASLGAGTLVCGAISRPLSEAMQAEGIRVIAFVAGDMDEIIKAWAENRLGDGGFAMPGCCRRRRRGRRCSR
jgi:predicted Fe-Mo cluster-binding NifX family protein